MRSGLVLGILVGVIFVSGAAAAYARGNREIIYRPVTLTVRDAETRQPLEGIPVIVVNVLRYYRPMVIDVLTGSVVRFYEFMTDEHGVVQIPQFSYRVNQHHFIHTQQIGLNRALRNRNARMRDQREWFELGTFFNNEVFF